MSEQQQETNVIQATPHAWHAHAGNGARFFGIGTQLTGLAFFIASAVTFDLDMMVASISKIVGSLGVYGISAYVNGIERNSATYDANAKAYSSLPYAERQNTTWKRENLGEHFRGAFINPFYNIKFGRGKVYQAEDPDAWKKYTYGSGEGVSFKSTGGVALALGSAKAAFDVLSGADLSTFGALGLIVGVTSYTMGAVAQASEVVASKNAANRTALREAISRGEATTEDDWKRDNGGFGHFLKALMPQNFRYSNPQYTV